ncbi:hypothetical protein Q3G72_016159 [Acer saccharum]|nr:hypothetical protein Q3G72_016159 [Acer saccharum]
MALVGWNSQRLAAARWGLSTAEDDGLGVGGKRGQSQEVRCLNHSSRSFVEVANGLENGIQKDGNFDAALEVGFDCGQLKNEDIKALDGSVELLSSDEAGTCDEGLKMCRLADSNNADLLALKMACKLSSVGSDLEVNALEEGMESAQLNLKKGTVGLNFINKVNDGGVNVRNECLDGERDMESDTLRRNLMGEYNKKVHLKFKNASGVNSKLRKASDGETKKRVVARKADGGLFEKGMNSKVWDQTILTEDGLKKGPSDEVVDGKINGQTEPSLSGKKDVIIDIIERKVYSGERNSTMIILLTFQRFAKVCLE